LETSARKFHFPVSLNGESLLVSVEQLAVVDDNGAVRVAARGRVAAEAPTQTDTPQMARQDNASHVSEITP
jgi:hypothetical protein